MLGILLALLLDALARKVTRHRLAAHDAHIPPWGVLHQEEALLQALFPSPPAASAAGPSPRHA